MGIVLIWINKALDFGNIEYMIFGLVLLVTIFCGFIFWGNFGNKKGKTKSFIYAMIWAAIWLPLTMIIGQIEAVTSVIHIS